MKITRPAYILGNHEEITNLYQATQQGEKILDCRNLQDYLKLANTLRTNKAVTGNYTSEQFFGIVMGQTFYNYWLIRAGIIKGLTYDKPASQYEDFRESTDSWCKVKGGEVARVSMKLVSNPFQSTKMDRLSKFFAQLAIDNRERIMDHNKPLVIPVLIETAHEPNHIVDDALKQLGGRWIGHQEIYMSIGHDNAAFFKDFVKLIEENYKYYLSKRQAALGEAKQKIKDRKYDSLDIQDIETLEMIERAVVIASPGFGKTDLEALGSIKKRLARGPVILVTRVKWLLEQIVKDVVELIDDQSTPDGHPERILLGSMLEHHMDLKPARAVGSVGREDVHQAVIEAFEKKLPTIIGCVGWNEKSTLKELLDLCEKKGFEVQIVIDEALEVFDATKTLPGYSEESMESKISAMAKINKDVISNLERLHEKGLLKTLHLFDAVYVKGKWGMDNPALGLSDKPTIKHTSEESISTNRTVPLVIVKHRILESDVRNTLKQYPGVEYDDLVEACMNASYYKWCLKNDSMPKLLTFTRSSSNSARFLVNDIREKFNPDKVGTILAGTKQSDRLKLKDAMNDLSRSSFVANIRIGAKGININNCHNVGISPNAELTEAYAVHIPPRAVRRADGERGLPLSECTKKEGRLHVGYVVDSNGKMSKSAMVMLDLIKQVRTTGIVHTIQEVRYTPPKVRQTLNIELEDERYANDVQSTVSDSDLTGKIEVVTEPDPILVKYTENENYLSTLEQWQDKSADEILKAAVEGRITY